MASIQRREKAALQAHAWIVFSGSSRCEPAGVGRDWQPPAPEPPSGYVIDRCSKVRSGAMDRAGDSLDRRSGSKVSRSPSREGVCPTEPAYRLGPNDSPAWPHWSVATFPERYLPPPRWHGVRPFAVPFRWPALTVPDRSTVLPCPADRGRRPRLPLGCICGVGLAWIGRGDGL